MDDIGFISDAIGWFGAACFLFAYIIATKVPGTSDKLYFHILNIVGAVCFAINAKYHGAVPLFYLNVIWVGLGLYAMYRIKKSAI